jgi:hypothetical protein
MIWYWEFIACMVVGLFALGEVLRIDREDGR